MRAGAEAASWLAAVAIVAIAAAPGASAAASGAASSAGAGGAERCGGLPRVGVSTPPGWCLARVADAAAGLRFPRRILEVEPGRYWVVDMGSWEPRRGRLLEFTLPDPARAPAGPVSFVTLADRLDRPLALVMGPDRHVWIGEAGRISRTPVGPRGAPARLQTVVDDLPADGSHPLKELAFDPDGRLYVNVGSSSDACRGPTGVAPLPCLDLQGPRPRAAIWQATLRADGTLQTLRTFATGLRNSLALAWVPGLGLLQGENSVDEPDAAFPPEELNHVREGRFYGWPYCVGDRIAGRGQPRFDCAGRSEGPLMAWPAHAAPLQMLAYPADAGHGFAGHLVVAWHGYRPGGHRLVAWPLDARGRPGGRPVEWIAGWDARGGQRLGTPAGFTVDSKGRLWVVEDRNRTLLLLLQERPAAR